MPNVTVRRPRTEQPQGPVPLRKELYENLLGYFPNSGNDQPTHPLTFAGNATYAETEFGRATKFDGAGDYTSAGDAFYSDEYTILVTVNANVLNADPKGIIVKRNLGTSASTNEIWLTATSTTIEMYAWQSGGTRILTLQSSLVPVAGQTYTIGIDIPPGSGGTAYMYVNGVQVASASKTGIIVDSATDLQFGCMGSGVAARYWNGYIGPAAFWRKRLPNTQELTASPWAILEDEEIPVWFTAGGPTLIELTAAVFGWTKNPIQNRSTATMSASSLKMNAQSIQNRSTIATALASLVFTAQSIQNKATVTLSTASLKFVAQAINVANGTATTVIELTTAAFNYSAKALQLSQRMALSAASLVFSPKSIQNRMTVTMTAATLSFVAKALQNKLTIALSVASFSFIAWAIDVTGAVASVVARLLTLLGVGS